MKKSPVTRERKIKLPAGRFEDVLRAALSTPPMSKKKPKSKRRNS